MAENFTLCFCELKDCIFYRPAPESERKCRCAHPEKMHYLNRLTCPLYKLDWVKKTREAAEAPKKKPRGSYGQED